MSLKSTSELENTRHLVVNGVDITYLKSGDPRDGTSVVFVHGSLQDLRSWRFQIKPLASQYRMFVYSRRNHYPNEWSDYPSDYSLKTERDDLVALLKDLRALPCHLIGSSYGAFICLLVARDYPKLVRSLIISEPPILSLILSKEPDFYNQSKLSYEENVAKPLRGREYERAVRYFVDSAEGAGTFNHLPSEVRIMMMDNARSLLMEDPKPERDPFFCSDATNIKCSTLLVQGENSPKMYDIVNAELRSCLPDSSCVVIKDTSHSIHNQNPSGYNAAVLTFLMAH